MNRVVAIHPPIGFSHQGQRENNEDYVLPPVGKATADHRLFVVCDGVGGAERGELASLIAAESVVNYFRLNPVEAVDVQYVKSALLHVESAFDQAIAAETTVNLRGMSTTMTLLSMHQQGVTIAHVGDSRVYHIRAGQILHQTHDHSLVNELVRTKQILPEEAAHHPRRNVITRAIQGSARPTTGTIYITQDIAENDYFFLCTDGVMECLNNDSLAHILADERLPDEQKVEQLLAHCAGSSHDNYSGYLIRVAAVAPIERPTPTQDFDDGGESVSRFHLLLDEGQATAREESRTWLQRLFS